ncbi:acetoin utilization protein AcuA [Virgibacillus natechei]|uniref:Acetoin utilization protein AcuA n=1 Tax=Virgibacillus natechei TaxID=1216297 RepID=A0ABS4IF13_9BACI|nr:GNAT family N-acetyltransferase [Virgibacillus natechei]MBP1968916.1 acetoin utilization protein AcuA [Virgibacillus natechei]UZD11708.1 GNAT family N-acetyltransferase [Virgibacillus natechei]
MKHTKTHYSLVREKSNESILIEGPLDAKELEKYNFHEDLIAFRPAKKQFEALLYIAGFPEGRIIVARTKDTIVGYVTYIHPDPMERWSEFNMEDLIELGAVEVVPEYRAAGVASGLLQVSMMDDYMENYIVISTEYYWHWDLDKTNLSIWDYRKVMEKMMASGGLTPAPTDDPEIISHPANCLMVRIGKYVPEESVKQFDKLRFLQRHQYQNMREGF